MCKVIAILVATLAAVLMFGITAKADIVYRQQCDGFGKCQMVAVQVPNATQAANSTFSALPASTTPARMPLSGPPSVAAPPMTTMAFQAFETVEPMPAVRFPRVRAVLQAVFHPVRWFKSRR